MRPETCVTAADFMQVNVISTFSLVKSVSHSQYAERSCATPRNAHYSCEDGHMENPGIDPGTSRMLSERSTI